MKSVFLDVGFVIKHYDKINNEVVELEVSDDVSKFLQADRKRLIRQAEEDRKHLAFSLDDYTKFNDEELLSVGELIADKDLDVEREIEQKEFSKIIWNVVDKLQTKQANAIKMIYLHGYKSKEVADTLNMNYSAFTQFKDTALKHLHILLSYDKYFAHTDYYVKHYKRFADDVIKQVKQEIAYENKVFSINLNNVYDLMKNVTQMNKITERLGVKIPEKTISLLNEMTKPVAEFFKVLKQNEKFKDSEQSNLNIPVTELLNLINN